MKNIERVAIIGAGVMGSGIAAHMVNCGLKVTLLDMTTELVDKGIQRQIKAGGFMDPHEATQIKTGSTKDDISLLAKADWIIEAIAENIDIKQNIYKDIDNVCKPSAIVSSNTSTIPLSALIDGMSDRFKSNFLITHFFNPPRHMPLFELVSGEKTSSAISQVIYDFANIQLGKNVVVCKDTPGFIANRIGNYWMLLAQNLAIEMDVEVELADAVVSKPFGIPSTGIFGLLDLVGIDLMPTIWVSLQNALPDGDALQDLDARPPVIAKMIENNRLGRKVGAGFNRISSNKQIREVIDFNSCDYRLRKSVSSKILDTYQGDLLKLMQHSSVEAEYASVVMAKLFAYVAALVPEISDTPYSVDQAMQSGYAWRKGPFELMDSIGLDWLIKLLQKKHITPPDFLLLAADKGGFYKILNGELCCLLPSGKYIPVSQNKELISIASIHRNSVPIMSSKTAKLWDIGDDVACLEIQTKMNTFSPELLLSIENIIENIDGRFKALIIGGDSKHFSAGADLNLFIADKHQDNNPSFEELIHLGQKVFNKIKFAPFPVVGAASGLALGGGCEILLHCDAIQTHAELSMGLVETGVGLVPGWGGCKELMLRLGKKANVSIDELISRDLKVFEQIFWSKISTSAKDAKACGFLRDTDQITMNRNRLLYDAKIKALSLVADYSPPEKRDIQLAGNMGIAELSKSVASTNESITFSTHDRLIAESLIGLICGTNTTEIPEEKINQLEFSVFLKLISTKASQDRIQHMLLNGKPLRN